MWLVKKLDWWFIGAIFLLNALGIFMLISLGSRAAEPFFWVLRQALWVGLGTIILFGITLIDYRVLRNSGSVTAGLYSLALILLMFVLLFGKTIRGSRGWFELGSLTFQPVEFAKVALIIALAKYFSAKNIEIWQIRHIAISLLLAAFPVALLLFQPDWGSALVLIMIWFLMVLFSGARTKHVVGLIIFFLLVGILAWSLALTSTQKARILTWLQPALDPYGISYSQRQALIAAGSGGFWGKGMGQGTQTQLKFLPEARTDFIFAAVAEELGLIGVLAVLGSYGLIFYRIFLMINNFSNNFSRLFGLGFLLLLGFHVFVNVGMNLGVFPVVGLALPFISYGGSSILANFVAAGILLSMKIRTL